MLRFTFGTIQYNLEQLLCKTWSQTPIYMESINHSKQGDAHSANIARSQKQGHDNKLHDCTTTMNPLQNLEMYKGSMSSELPINHCLGAASEGGVQRHTSYIHVQTSKQTIGSDCNRASTDSRVGEEQNALGCIWLKCASVKT